MSYFTDREFERASPAGLTAEDRAAIALWRPILDAARAWYGGPLVVTSYARRGGGAHAAGRGYAVDVQPASGGETRIRDLAGYFAHNFLGAGLRQVIYEPPAAGQWRGHVHLARVLVPGARPGYLVEEGETYAPAQVASLPPLPSPAGGASPALPAAPSPSLAGLAGVGVLGLLAARILLRG